jgi:zinc/manganese transport system substrate-binding protein
VSLAANLATGLAAAGCGATATSATTGDAPIVAVGAKDEYANVISQIGGRFVTAPAIESNPNADLHSFEASPSIAHAVSSARVVLQNGLGYDTFMNRIEAASPSSSRKIVDVQKLLGLPDSTHLIPPSHDAGGGPGALVNDLSATDPAHAGYFASNAPLRCRGRLSVRGCR